MNQYEVMYVIDTTLDDEARTALINRFSNLVEVNGGKVDRVDEWQAPSGVRHRLQDGGLLRADVRDRPRRAAP